MLFYMSCDASSCVARYRWLAYFSISPEVLLGVGGRALEAMQATKGLGVGAPNLCLLACGGGVLAKQEK
jgi:hypothetical protein